MLLSVTKRAGIWARTFRRPNDNWAQSPTTKGSSDASREVALVVLAFLAVQVVAVVWFSLASVVFPSLADSSESRPIWTILIGSIGLWGGSLLASVGLAWHLGIEAADYRLGSDMKQGVLGLFAGVGTQLAVLPVLYWFVLSVVDGDPQARVDEIAERIGGTGDVLLLVLAVVVVAPLVEELFYRGLLLRVLSSWIGRLGGAVSCSIVFAIVHPGAITYPGLFLFSLVLCGLTMLTGRLGPAVIAHMAFNAAALVSIL